MNLKKILTAKKSKRAQRIDKAFFAAHDKGNTKEAYKAHDASKYDSNRRWNFLRSPKVYNLKVDNSGLFKT